MDETKFSDVWTTSSSMKWSRKKHIKLILSRDLCWQWWLFLWAFVVLCLFTLLGLLYYYPSATFPSRWVFSRHRLHDKILGWFNPPFNRHWRIQRVKVYLKYLMWPKWLWSLQNFCAEAPTVLTKFHTLIMIFHIFCALLAVQNYLLTGHNMIRWFSCSHTDMWRSHESN